MQRRVEQPDRDREALHRLEDPFEVPLLKRKKLVEGRLALLFRLRHDHRLHLRLAVGLHEHVLRPAKADALRPELSRFPGVLGVVGVRANTGLAQLVGPLEDRAEVLSDLGLDQWNVFARDLARGAVDRDQVTAVKLSSVHPHLAGIDVDVELGRPAHARPTHPSRHQCSV